VIPTAPVADSVAEAEVDPERWARVWLSRTVEPGSVALHVLLAECGAAEAVARIRAGEVASEVLRVADARRAGDRVGSDLARAAACGVRLVIPGDEEWPTAALQPLVVATGLGRADLAPPVALWVRGETRLDVAMDRCVSIIGARAATAYGQHLAGELAYGVAERGWTVVSGGAYGIDGAAHRGALATGGSTVAVLAGGLDSPYPAGHRSLFERIVAAGGLLVSEWPVASAPQRHRFLVRNRLIAAVGAGTVVVEAAARSGTSATARHAETLGRSLMAVPGPVTSAMSVGTHQLMRERDARLVTSAADVLEEVGPIGATLVDRPRAPADPRDVADPVGRRVLDGVPARRGATPERIAVAAGVPVADVLRALPALHLHDLVEPAEDGWRLARRLRPPRRR
jgi:DNA processing protein